MRKKIIIILSLVIPLLVVFIGWRVYETGLKKADGNLKIVSGDIDLEIKEFVYTEIGENKAKWEVKARNATYDKKQNLACLDQVKIKLITSNGKVFEMSADQGKMDTEKKDVEISGNVIVLTDSGDKFMTNHIYYNDRQKRFYTDAPVMMESKGMRITGRGMVLYMNKGELNIPSMVRAKIK